VTYGTEQAIAV